MKIALFPNSISGLAVLSAALPNAEFIMPGVSNSFTGCACLTAAIEDDDGWVQLLPAGKFKARDGRPHDTDDGYWHLDAATAEAMIAATKAVAPKVLVDYDHATLRVEQTGSPAPAAAWLSTQTDLEWREGKGLYIRPSWTDKAQAHIDANEYAFLSAVFPYDKQGRPLYLRMAAITNDPGLVGLDPVAMLAADINVRLSSPGVDINLYGSTEDSVLNEQLKKLLAKLGIVVDGELTDELATAALTALDALQQKADKTAELETQVATLSANPNVDLAKFVSIEAYQGVVEQLAVLKAGSDEHSITSVISNAKKAGKIVEAEVNYLTSFGKQQGVAALSAMLEKRPAIAALSGQQTTTTTIKDATKTNEELSQDQLAILKAAGVSKEQFLKTQEIEA
jgi:phage I-like protein